MESGRDRPCDIRPISISNAAQSPVLHARPGSAINLTTMPRIKYFSDGMSISCPRVVRPAQSVNLSK
jgi:hypothetical protein